MTEDLPSLSGATRTHRGQSRSRTPSFVLFRNDEVNILGQRMTSPSHLQSLQNNGNLRYQERLNLSPSISPASSEDQGDDILQSFFSRIIVNSSLSNQTLSAVNERQADANAIRGSPNQGREVNTTSP